MLGEEDHLLKANRNIAEGMLRVVQQKRRLAELERDGHDTRNARALLATFYNHFLCMRNFPPASTTTRPVWMPPVNGLLSPEAGGNLISSKRRNHGPSIWGPV